jgi:hypothetical protein
VYFFVFLRVASCRRATVARLLHIYVHHTPPGPTTAGAGLGAVVLCSSVPILANPV